MAANFFVLIFILAEVTSWTIDLPERRRFYFEKYSKNEPERAEEAVFNPPNESQRNFTYYSNVEGNSLHNTPAEDEKYANEYNYLSYMEKKVHKIVHSGSRYLEGLRRSIERFARRLEECNRGNFSSPLIPWLPQAELPLPNATAIIPNSSLPSPTLNSSLSPLPISNLNPWWRDINRRDDSDSRRDDRRGFDDRRDGRRGFGVDDRRDSGNFSCDYVTRESEYVRRLTDLAVSATSDLQDLAYDDKYSKDDEDHRAEQELEIIMKLAWFLDKLALLTGYEPNENEFAFKSVNSVSTPPPFTLMNAPPNVTLLMMNCMKETSSIPAVDRCRFPLPPTSLFQQIFNVSVANIVPPSAPTQDDWLRFVGINDPTVQTDRNLNTVQPIRNKRSTPTDNPLLNVVKYYTKYKTWQYSNIENNNKPDNEVDADNNLNLKSVHKRSVVARKAALIDEHDHIPHLHETEPQHTKFVERYIDAFAHKLKHKIHTKLEDVKHRVKDHVHHKVAKIHETIATVKHNAAYAASHGLYKLSDPHYVHKRSIGNSEWKVPEDPMQDISKYVKHKPGVNYVRNEDMMKEMLDYFKIIRNGQSGYISTKDSDGKPVYKRSTEQDHPNNPLNYNSDKHPSSPVYISESNPQRILNRVGNSEKYKPQGLSQEYNDRRPKYYQEHEHLDQQPVRDPEEPQSYISDRIPKHSPEKYHHDAQENLPRGNKPGLLPAGPAKPYHERDHSYEDNREDIKENPKRNEHSEWHHNVNKEDRFSNKDLLRTRMHETSYEPQRTFQRKHEEEKEYERAQKQHGDYESTHENLRHKLENLQEHEHYKNSEYGFILPDRPPHRYTSNIPEDHFKREHLPKDPKENNPLEEYKEYLQQRQNIAKDKAILASYKKHLPFRHKYLAKDLPRESEDPHQDISFYVKNKPGTNYNRNLIQALQVRAALEAIFQNGNIAVISRFGSNYNPAVPIPFAAGIAATMADF